MTIDLILGTAGHIDHGKTSLIRALTGVDTDRLPEEKKRGITIELGFAELDLGDYRLGIVDVPGHERFVRNMLAGATGMDIAMLVVAADDSIKPQTREHLEILRLLDLEAGVIALTKCDLAEPDWIELVEEEIRELVKDTFLATAPIVRTSTATGQGIDDLRERLTNAAAIVAAKQHAARIDAPFRMAIDRTFTITGHGTVVTGSVSSGQAKLGDMLMIEPGDIEVRVRGLQNHDRQVDEIHRGQRAAINLAGIHHDQTKRGQELATAGHLRPSRLLTVELTLLASTPRPLKNRARIRVHVGTAELLAGVSLLGRDKLDPGETGYAQLFLSEPAVTVWSQPFVARSESPIMTIGGGRVLAPDAQRIRKPDEVTLQMLDALNARDAIDRASAALYFSGLRDWQPADLARTAGIDNPIDLVQPLIDRGDLREIPVTPTRVIRVHRRRIEQVSRQIEAVLAKMHEQNPLRSTLDRSRLSVAFKHLGDESLLDAVLADMQRDRRIRVTDRGIALTGHGPKLSNNERKLLAELIDIFRQAGMQAPTVKECQKKATKNQQAVPQLISLAAADGDLVEVGRDFYLHIDVERELRDSVIRRLSNGDGATMSELRELLNTSRKYAVPYLEYLDQIGVTKRDGDLRVLGNASQD